MPSQEPTRSPSRRPQINDRPSSSTSITKVSPKGAPLLNTHKGSSTRLHKGHAVGHGRPTHTRVPSHGRGLNRLAKAGHNPAADESNPRHKRTPSTTPSTSPSDLANKRNSSTVNLQRPNSRGKVKRNASHPALIQNGKLGNQPKSEKSQLKKSLLKQHTDDSPLRGTTQFELADDDEWTEDSGSQSPATTRTYSRPKTPITPAPKDLPTPDEPPQRRSPQLPHSPPDSPKLDGSQKIRNGLSHPPDAQDVTTRLLNRNGIHAIPAKTSNISANVTPHHVGSPKIGSVTSSTHEPSMPADGISRFLSRTNSTPGNTPSIFQLHQNLTNFDHAPTFDSSDTRRVRSAANLTHQNLSSSEGASTSTSPSREEKPFKPSPFESAKGANPRAGKSYTQLKMNLDREAVSRDPPLSNHPLLSQGSALNSGASMSMNPAEMAQRLRRQYASARKDVTNCRKYYPDIVTGRIPEKAVKKHELALRKVRSRKDPEVKSAVGSADTGKSAGEGKRGRVRFEVGHQARDDAFVDEDRGQEEDVAALLRRMWFAEEPREILED